MPWRTIDDYHELVFINSAFIQGDIDKSPYMGGPFEAETSSPIEDLIALHRYGIIVVESTPSLVMAEPIESPNPSRSGYLYEARQRSNLVFFMPSLPTYMAALKTMYDRPDLFAVSVTIVYNKGWDTNYEEPLVLVESREAPSTASLAKRRFRVRSTVMQDDSLLDSEVFDDFPNIVEQLKFTVCVSVASTLPFGQGDVPKALIDVLDALHIEPHYAVLTK